MNDITKRILLFLILCIGARSTLVYLAYTLPTKYLRWMGYLLLLPAMGFSYLFLTNSRKKGPETFGSPIWWNYLRPVHAILYFIAGYYAINEDSEKATTVLLIDVIIGLIGFFHYHITNNSFRKFKL